MSNPVMYYDGECGLCARAVQWCLNNDRRGVILFAPIQGETYTALDTPNKPTDVSTMAFSEGTSLALRSTAVLRMMANMGGPWSTLAAIGKLIPTGVRDSMYNFVAKRRIKWFGTAESCALPTPAQRARMLQ